MEQTRDVHCILHACLMRVEPCVVSDSQANIGHCIWLGATIRGEHTCCCCAMRRMRKHNLEHSVNG